MPSQEDIRHQQSLLNTYSRNLAPPGAVKRHPSAGVGSRAVHIINSLDDTRANIRRIKRHPARAGA